MVTLVLGAVLLFPRQQPAIIGTLPRKEANEILCTVRRELRRDIHLAVSLDFIRHLPSSFHQYWFNKIRSITVGPEGYVEVLTGGDPSEVEARGSIYGLHKTTNGWILGAKSMWFNRAVIAPNPTLQ